LPESSPCAQVLPRGKIVPRIGQSVEVAFGEPVFIADLWEAWHQGTMSDEACYTAVAARVQLAMARVKADLDGTVEGDLPAVLGVDPGVLGEREPRQPWWSRLARRTLPASFAAGGGASPLIGGPSPRGLSLGRWRSVLCEHARLLGIELSGAAALEADDAYGSLRSAEVLRILST